MGIKAGYAQFDCKFGDKEANLATMSRLVEAARAELLVFPEMCTTGYMVEGRPELAALAEPLSGPTVEAMAKIAKNADTVIIFGMPEQEDGKLFSSAVAVGPGGLLAKHQKTHLFLREKLCFDSGTTAPTLFEWRGVRVGLGVCYDYMFPEYWRKLALDGADLFCNAANFVYDYGFRMMQARAIENGVFSICTNRIGTERGASFRGGSELINPRGGLLSKAREGEEWKIGDLDPAQARDKKWNPYNDLFKDRRPEMYL